MAMVNSRRVLDGLVQRNQAVLASVATIMSQFCSTDCTLVDTNLMSTSEQTLANTATRCAKGSQARAAVQGAPSHLRFGTA